MTDLLALQSEDFERPSSLKAQKEADEQRKGFSDTQINQLRLHAKTNLFFLASTILGFDKLSADGLHGQFCSWLDKTRGVQNRIQLLPRGHYKTTVSTISDSIQIILPDDSGNQPFPRNLGTDCRLVIGHEVVDQAASFLSSITSLILTRPFLMALFPEIVPGKQHRVNKYQLELPRSRSWPEPTIDTIGVGTRGQGRHYDFMKLDDIYGVEARDSPAAHKTTINWLSNVPAFLTSLSGGHIDFIGTRYSREDVYAKILEIYEGDIKKYIRPVYERNLANERELIFPEIVTWKEIERLKKDPLVFNAQYLNNPMDADGEFQQDWERYYEWSQLAPHRDVVVNTEEGIRKTSIWEMDRVILIDPATVGESGIVVTGTDTMGPRYNVYVLDAIQEALPHEKFIAKIFELVAKWQPRMVVVEDVLFSRLYQHILATEQVARGIHFRIAGCSTQQKVKEDRVRGLRSWFANSQIYFHKSQVELIDQFRYFGSIKEFHLLDSLAQGPRLTTKGEKIWRVSAGVENLESRENAILKMKSMTDRSTGYSRIIYK